MTRPFQLLLLLILAVPTAHAQLNRGSLSGTLSDDQGGLIAGGQATITNQDTNISQSTITNEVGIYRFAALEVGLYTVEFRMEGFDTQRIVNIRVSALKESVLNRTMGLGTLNTEVNVTTVPGVDLQKTDPTIGRTLTGTVVEELPLTSSRDITRIALLAPTVVRAPGSNEFSANGQRARNNNFTIDGVDNNDITTSLNAGRLNTPEAVEEVRIQVAPFSAEFGRATGAQFAVITKHGTNIFHGEGWDYHRANWLEPVSLVNKRAGLTETPRFVSNQFGGSLGGPILHDKTFFFGLLESTLGRTAPDARNSSPANIPTPVGYAALQNVPLRAGQSAASRQTVLGTLNFLPEIQAQVTRYENVRSTTVNGVPVEVGTILIPIANPQTLLYNVGRIDHQLTARDSLSYRYYLDQRDQPDWVGNLAFGSKWTASQQIRAQNHSISHTHTFASHFVNEARLAYVRKLLDFPERDPKSSTVNISNFFTIGGASTFPQSRLDQQYQFQNVSSYVASHNSFRFGVDVRFGRSFNRTGTHSKGTWTFQSLETFMNNSASSLQQAITESTFNAKQVSQSYFVQDDFRLTKNFTASMGLRYETTSVPLDMFGATDPEIHAAGVRGPGERDTNNWAPRLGFAYSPNATQGILGKVLGNGESSIRGGFGVSYDVVYYNILASLAGNFPRVVTQNDTTNVIDAFPTLLSKTATTPAFDPMLAFVNTPEDLQMPTTNFWTLSIQRQLATDYEIELGYTGNRSYHMFRQTQANPAVLTPQQAATVLAGGSIPSVQARRLNPAWNSRTIIESTAKGEYHAGYVRFDRKMSGGLLIGANYTWSANFSDGDEPFGEPAIVPFSPQVPQDFFNYRPEWSRSAFDRPHRVAVHYLYLTPAMSSLGPLSHVLSGWEIGGLTEWQSGQPFTIRTGLDTQGTGNANPGRPNFNPGGIMAKDPDTGDLRTFTIPLNGTGIVTATLVANSMPGGGNLGRNTFRGPSFQNWNLNLAKQVAITEGIQMQFRGDFTNLFNHNNFGNPETRMSNSAFGANTSAPITDTRQIVLGAKLVF